ncbi:MAG: site-2 protease family protein, partial [Kaistella sp.]
MTLIQLFQFILSISILVVLHELGHFLPAKYFKTKVEKFYLFFDPWFSLAKVKFRGTEYGIGWLPFGGYVKIAGMVDESMDTEQLKKPAEPWEFRSKPAWQRLIIMMGGVTVNFFLAWFIYSSLSYFKGETYHDNSKFENGIAVSDAGKKMGLQTGDKILRIDGKHAERMETSTINMLFADEVTVLRNGKEVTFPINEQGVADVLAQNEAKAYFTPRFPVVIDSLLPNGSAKTSGLVKGDKIVAINGKPVKYFDELGTELANFKNQNVVLDVERNSAVQKMNIKVDPQGKLGFSTDLNVAQAE